MTGVEPRPIDVVIIDDHALFRQGARAAISPAVNVVAEADDVDTGIEAVLLHRPQVVLLDVHLTSGSGTEVIESVRSRTGDGSPPTEPIRFLGLSVSDEPADVMRLVRAGARGYVTKRIDGPSLIEAITRVAQGEAVFSPRLAGFVLDAFAQPPDAAIGLHTAGDEPSEIDIDRLSTREREVMRYLARGYTYKEIGVELHISPRTVESHASAVLRKLQLSNRHELTHWAARNRYI